MPAVAVGAVFTTIGGAAVATTATTVVSTIVASAVVGAITGAAVAVVSGGDPMDGALKGAVVGGITGGLSSMFNGAQAAGTGVESTGASLATEGSNAAGNVAVDLETGAASTAGTTGAGVGATNAGTSAAASTATQATTQTAAQGGGGILSKVGGWINSNPNAASIIAQTLGGAAESILSGNDAEDTIKAQKELAKMQIDATKVSGLGNLDTGTVAIPKIETFTQKPSWRLNEPILSNNNTAVETNTNNQNEVKQSARRFVKS